MAWSREFRLWHYSVSYSRLLVRRVNVPDAETRVDFIFSNVRRILVDHEYKTLTIDKPEMGDVGYEMKNAYENWQNIFVVNAGPDFIIASHCQWHEDMGDARTPSKFGPFRRTD